jgi:hypothetical protein
LSVDLSGKVKHVFVEKKKISPKNEKHKIEFRVKGNGITVQHFIEIFEEKTFIEDCRQCKERICLQKIEGNLFSN